MASLYILEFSGVMNAGFSDKYTDGTGAYPVGLPLLPPLIPRQPAVAIGPEPGQSNVFNPYTTVIGLYVDGAAFVDVGVAPNAQLNGWPIPVGQWFVYAVPPGSGFKVSVIAAG